MNKINITFMAILCMCSITLTAHADERSVSVKEIHGQVFHQKAGEGGWLPSELETVLNESDVVKTSSDSTAKLVFGGESNTTVDVRPDTILALATVGKKEIDDETELEVFLGSVLIKAEKLQGASRFEVRTPNSIVGIRGTEFEITVE